MQIETTLKFDRVPIIIKLLDGRRLRIPVDIQKDTPAHLATVLERDYGVQPQSYIMTFGNFELTPSNISLVNFQVSNGSLIVLQPPLLVDSAVSVPCEATTDQNMRVFSARPEPVASSSSASPRPVRVKRQRSDCSSCDDHDVNNNGDDATSAAAIPPAGPRLDHQVQAKKPKMPEE